MSDDLKNWIDKIPGKNELKFSLDRTGLYTVDDLLRGYQGTQESYLATYDQVAYKWFFDTETNKPWPRSLEEAIGARVHDAEIQNGIDEFLATDSNLAVGFMGGHGMKRDSVGYRQVAIMARELRKANFKIITGGGPGAMEAANLGAFLAGYEYADLDEQLAVLKDKELTLKDSTQWLNAALKVKRSLLDSSDGIPPPLSSNLGIPCWLYGNEPPNVFATAIGKYFYNSVREDGLVTLASGGLIFAEGGGGTVQEVFQNACVNFYAQKPIGSYPTTPMAFLGEDVWNPDMTKNDVPIGHVPVIPLLMKLAKDAILAAPPFPEQIFTSDDPQMIVQFLIGQRDKRKVGQESLAERLLTRRMMLHQS